MKVFEKSLHYKFTLATVIGFLISSLVFLVLFLTFYQNELEQERAQAAQDVNRLLQSSLENAMLKRDLEGLDFIVRRLGKQPNINRVMITNPSGQVRFASHQENMEQALDMELVQATSPKTHFMESEDGEEVLRSINPVHNKVQCQECHGPMENNPINGILVVDYNASTIRQKTLHTTLMLMGAGALIVIINLLGGWLFIRRFILQPVESLSAASHLLSQGQLDTRVKLSDRDELSELGETFNLMAARLQSSIRELEEGKAFLQAIVDNIPDGLRIIDKGYNTLLVNKAFREQMGHADKNWLAEKCYQAHNLDTPCPAELITCPLDVILKENKPLKVIHHHSRCNGDTLDVEIYAAPMSIIKQGTEVMLMVESIRDLTSQVRFTHEQRLSELGRLAAGVAHEIYNPLSTMKLAIHSLTTTLEAQVKAKDIQHYLNVVETEMEQCIQITDRLLHLSAAPLAQPELVELNKALKDILSLVQWDANDASIEIIEFFPEQPLRVIARESEIRMLFLNLVQNAFHAMPEGGQLTITGGLEDEEVVIQFKDTGIGISAELLPRIFMPFFSQRADGVHGTGLGLPISKAIVENFNGSLSVNSAPGKGSCFTIRMPEATLERLTL